MCKDFTVNWDKIEKVRDRGKYIDRKIYTEHLFKDSRGYVNWRKSVGMIVPILHNNIEYDVIIEDYVPNNNNPYLIINIEGYYKIDSKIRISSFSRGKIQYLINNVYANPNYEYRQLIIDSIGEEEAKKLTIGSNKKIDLTCKDCGSKHIQNLNNLHKQGFSCPRCGRGTSYPERIVALVLKTLGIKFKKQHRFDGYSYKYDFYLIDYDIIIEVHGIQHYWYLDVKTIYNRMNVNGRNGIEEHENDLTKYDLAVLNGYEYNKNYFVIDTRKSNINHIRNSIEQCKFFQQLDLSIIDWKEIDKQVQKSQKMDVCRRWKEGKEVDKNLITTDLAKEFGVERNTIREYLKWGNENGLCKYNGEEERQARNERRSIFVMVVKPNGEKWFDKPMSKIELARQSGIGEGTIHRCVNNGEPLKYNNRAKYDPKYIGSYIMTVEDYNLKYGSN